MTEHLLDMMLSRAASVLGLGLLLACTGNTDVRAAAGLVGTVLVVAGTFGHLLVGTTEIAGTLSAGAVTEIARTTAFGSSAATAIGSGMLLAIAHAVARRRLRGARLLSAALAIAFALAISAQGHAAAPHARTLVHALHLGAASAWLGGLVALVDAVERGYASPKAVHAFSRLALWLVVLLVATGIARAGAHVGSLAELGSDYGRVLLLKLALGAGALAFAARHRRTTLPLLSEGVGIPPAFRRDLTAELVLAFCILLAAAALGQLPPPRD